MLCGFCAKEQNIADVCAFCHKQLVKGTQKTGHWEGGYGCRDQTNLSRKDNKKQKSKGSKGDSKDDDNSKGDDSKKSSNKISDFFSKWRRNYKKY